MLLRFPSSWPHTQEFLTVPAGSGSQMLQQLQHAAGLYIKAAIDGLVRHAPRLGLWRRRFSQPAICSGDQLSSSFPTTACRNGPCIANLHGFGRSACFHASLSAAPTPVATYPPLRLISRLTVDAARANILAIAGPIGLHNASRYLLAFRHRQRQTGSASGRRHDPPLGLKCAKMQEDGLPKARPIDFRPSPFFQRSQSSALRAAVNPTR